MTGVISTLGSRRPVPDERVAQADDFDLYPIGPFPLKQVLREHRRAAIVAGTIGGFVFAVIDIADEAVSLTLVLG